jgi:hypothetical protein
MDAVSDVVLSFVLLICARRADDGDRDRAVPALPAVLEGVGAYR